MEVTVHPSCRWCADTTDPAQATPPPSMTSQVMAARARERSRLMRLSTARRVSRQGLEPLLGEDGRGKGPDPGGPASAGENAKPSAQDVEPPCLQNRVPQL